MLNGQDISDDVLGTARPVIREVLRQEFEPAMQRYLDRLADDLSSRLDFNLDLGSAQLDSGTGTGNEFLWKGLGTALAPLLMKMKHPLALVAAAIAPLLGALLDSITAQKRQQLEEARRREQVKSHVRSALSDAIRQIDAQLRPVLTEQVQKAHDEVSRNVHAKRDELKRTLDTLITALKQSEAETAALRQRAQADLDQMKAMLAELEPSA